jgi:F0F1-type ATP synthase alpha subunit
VAIIVAASRGYLDAVEPGDIPRVNEEIRSALRDEGSILTEIRDSKDLPDALQDKLGSFLEGLMKRLVGTPAGTGAAA